MSRETGEKEEQRKKGKPGLIIVIIAVILALGLLFGLYVYPQHLRPMLQYSAAASMFNAGRYAEAEQAFLALGDYKDSAEVARQSRYLYAMELLASGQREQALPLFESLGLYGKSTVAIHYINAINQRDAGDTETALNNLRMILDFHDSREQVCEMEKAIAMPVYEELLNAYEAKEYENVLAVYGSLQNTLAAFSVYEESPEDETVQKVRYARAVSLAETGDYTGAAAAFAELGSYADAAEMAASTYALSPQGRYENACALEEAGETDEAIREFELLGDYLDSAARYQTLVYSKGVRFYENGEYAEAAACFEKILSNQDAEHYWQLSGYQAAIGMENLNDRADALVSVEISKMTEEEKDSYEQTCFGIAETLEQQGDYPRAFRLYQASGYGEYEQRMEECNRKYLSTPLTLELPKTVDSHVNTEDGIISSIECCKVDRSAVFMIHLKISVSEEAKGFARSHGYEPSINIYPIKTGAKYSEKAVGSLILSEKDKGDTITISVPLALLRNYRSGFYFMVQLRGNYFDDKYIEYGNLPTTDLYGNFVW